MDGERNRSGDAAQIKASVCMAVYNGARFLALQVESILAQLQPTDELLIVDDASRDRSPLILGRIEDPRVRIYRNERNMGVLATVEKALRLISGEIVFLSDQDDVWLPGKMEKIENVFLQRPDVTLVATDASVIDEKGTRLNESFYSRRGKFSSGFLHNFAKNKYLGCTLAFRSKMLDYFLPIPADVPMHDMWFGLLNSLYGKTYFIDEPLIAYRRHERNASPFQHAGMARMVSWRWHLFRNIAFRVFERSGASRCHDAR